MAQQPSETEHLERWAHWLRERRLQVPALLAIESVRPLRSLVYQGTLFMSPLLEIVGVPGEKLSHMWDDPQLLEFFLTRLEVQP